MDFREDRFSNGPGDVIYRGVWLDPPVNGPGDGQRRSRGVFKRPATGFALVSHLHPIDANGGPTVLKPRWARSCAESVCLNGVALLLTKVGGQERCSES